MKHNELVIARRAKTTFIVRVAKVAGKRRLAKHLRKQLHNLFVYCDVNADFPQHKFETLDELAILASCHVNPARTLAEKDEERQVTLLCCRVMSLVSTPSYITDRLPCDTRPVHRSHSLRLVPFSVPLIHSHETSSATHLPRSILNYLALTKGAALRIYGADLNRCNSTVSKQFWSNTSPHPHGESQSYI